MVSKRAAHSRSEDDLPAGWSKRLHVLNTGRKVKYYEDSRTGQKLFSKDHILQYVEIHDALQPTERRVRRCSNPGKLHASGTEEATNELLKWLPRGWLVRIRYRKSGPGCGEAYKTYVEQSTGRMFYSRVEMLRYLKSVKGKSGRSPAASAKPKVVIETSSEDLPPGWIKELQIQKSAGRIRKDPYYRDPTSGCLFRSRREVEHYLETGEISRRALSGTGRRIIGKHPLTSAKGKNLIDHNAGAHLSADNRCGVRKIATPSAASTSRKHGSEMIMCKTEHPSVSTSQISHEHCPESNMSSSYSSESQERISDSKQGNGLDGTSQSRFSIVNANNEEDLILPRRFSRRVAGIERDMVLDSAFISLATQDESAGDGANLKDIAEEPIVESENDKENNGNSTCTWRDSDKIIEVISQRRFSRRLARLTSEQESKSISKALAATNSHEGRDVAATTSKCMTTEASRSSLPIVNSNNEEDLTLPRQVSRRVAELEPRLVPDSVSKSLATQEEAAGHGATEDENDKEYNGNSPGGWRDSDKIKEVISHRRFSRRPARFKYEEESKSISKAVVIPDATNSHEDKDVTATSTSNCMTIEASQFLEVTVDMEKQEDGSGNVDMEKQEDGSGNACMRLLRKGPVKVQVNLQDKTAPKVATPVETGSGSSLVSTPPANVLNQETTSKHDEGKSMHSKRLDFSQETSKCSSVPMLEYPSSPEISKTKHIEMVGSQDASVVNHKDDIIQEKGFPLSARSVRWLKRTGGLGQETVGKPPQCESIDGDNTMSLPVKDIPGKQHQDVETNQTRNDDDNNNSIPDTQHQDVETNAMRNDKTNSWFGSSSADIWSDPCIEFAFKTLTGALPIEDFLSTPLVSSTAVCNRNEKNLQLDTSQKITEKESKVPSTVHKRETVLALKSQKQGKLGNAESFSRGASSPNSLQNDSGQKHKVGGFVEYANNDFGFAKRAKHYTSSSKSQEPHRDSTIKPSLLGNLVVRSTQNGEAAPTSFLPFGDCWSDPLLEYALEKPTGLIPLKGDLSKIVWLQQRIGTSCSIQRNTSFQLHETNLDQKDGKTDVSHSCFETDNLYRPLAPDQSRPISKPRTPIHQQPQLASATPIVLACTSSMNSAESHLNDRPTPGSMNSAVSHLNDKPKRGRPRKKP